MLPDARPTFSWLTRAFRSRLSPKVERDSGYNSGRGRRRLFGVCFNVFSDKIFALRFPDLNGV